MVDGFDLSQAALQLGPVVLDRVRCELRGPAQTVRIDQKACQVLMVLVDAAGTPVSRDDLLERAWPGVTVAPVSVSVQMHALRDAFRKSGCTEPPILTLKSPARYQFCLPVSAAAVPAGWVAPATPADAPAVSLPEADSPVSQGSAQDWSVAAGRMVLAPAATSRTRRLIRAGATAAGVFMVAAALAVFSLTGGGGEKQPLAIAVLPLQAAGNVAQAERLAGPLTEDLVIDLGRIPGSRVISRESAAALLALGLPDADLAQRLHARYVLHGTVSADETGYAVSYYLNDAVAGTRVAGFSSDFGSGEMGGLRRVVEGRIFNSVQREIAEAAYRANSTLPAEKLDALGLYYRAQHVMDGGSTGADYDEAIALLRKAVSLEGNFVEARAALAYWLLAKGFSGAGQRSVVDWNEADALIDTALRMSPRNPAALVAHAYALEIGHRRVEAVQVARDVLDIQPSQVIAYAILLQCAWLSGDLDGTARVLAELEAIDPLNPRRGNWRLMRGHLDLLQGRPAEAVTVLKQASADFPENVGDAAVENKSEFAQVLLISALVLAGQTTEARALYFEYNERFRNRSVWRLMSRYVENVVWLDARAGIWQALAAAGMPLRGSESAQPDTDCKSGTSELAIPPKFLTGAKVYDTSAMKTLAAGSVPPLVIDIGPGFSSMQGALWSPGSRRADEVEPYVEKTLKQVGEGVRDVIVMDGGAFGCAGYRAVRYLVAQGRYKVGWYRGGEEAWSATGLAVDRLALRPSDQNRQAYGFLASSIPLTP